MDQMQLVAADVFAAELFGQRSKCLAKPAALARRPTTAQRFSSTKTLRRRFACWAKNLENREGGPVGCSKLFGHHQLQQRFLTPSLGMDPPLGSSTRRTPVLLLMGATARRSRPRNIAAADRFGKVLAKIDADGQANHGPPR